MGAVEGGWERKRCGGSSIVSGDIVKVFDGGDFVGAEPQLELTFVEKLLR